MRLDGVVEVDNRAGKTGGDLDAEFVRSASDQTEEFLISDSSVDSSERARIRDVDRCIKRGAAER
jgi:hypothetical protein